MTATAAQAPADRITEIQAEIAELQARKTATQETIASAQRRRDGLKSAGRGILEAIAMGKDRDTKRRENRAQMAAIEQEISDYQDVGAVVDDLLTTAQRELKQAKRERDAEQASTLRTEARAALNEIGADGLTLAGRLERAAGMFEEASAIMSSHEIGFPTTRVDIREAAQQLRTWFEARSNQNILQ